MITLRLSIEELNVLDNVLPSLEALPAIDTIHLLSVTGKVEVAIEDYRHESALANAEHQVEQRGER